MKIVFFGGGNMGQAIITALLKDKVARPAELLVYDPNAAKRRLFARMKVNTETSDYSKLKRSEVIVLAVKPQDMLDLLETIKHYVPKKAIVLSIAAGVTLKRIGSLLKGHKLVRCLPNTPAQIQLGVTVWSANRLMTVPDKKKAQLILDAMGHSIYFPRESMIDAAGTINGSGPAYVFYFIEALALAGRRLGLSATVAEELATATFVGSSVLLAHSGESPEALRKKVTSKNGITEAAIKMFDSGKVDQGIIHGLLACYKRTKELNIGIKENFGDFLVKQPLTELSFIDKIEI